MSDYIGHSHGVTEGCPFCGAQSPLTVVTTAYKRYVWCPTCGARGPCVKEIATANMLTHGEAIDRWNTRHEAAKADIGITISPEQPVEVTDCPVCLHNKLAAHCRAVGLDPNKMMLPLPERVF